MTTKSAPTQYSSIANNMQYIAAHSCVPTHFCHLCHNCNLRWPLPHCASPEVWNHDSEGCSLLHQTCVKKHLCRSTSSDVWQTPSSQLLADTTINQLQQHCALTLVQWDYVSQGSSLLLRICVNEHCLKVPQESSDKNHCIDYFKALQSISQLQLSSSTAPWLLNTMLTHLMILLCYLKLRTISSYAADHLL